MNVCTQCGKPSEVLTSCSNFVVLCDSCTLKELLKYLRDLRNSYHKRDVKIPGETMALRYTRWVKALKELM